MGKDFLQLVSPPLVDFQRQESDGLSSGDSSPVTQPTLHLFTSPYHGSVMYLVTSATIVIFAKDTSTYP